MVTALSLRQHSLYKARGVNGAGAVHEEIFFFIDVRGLDKELPLPETSSPIHLGELPSSLPSIPKQRIFFNRNHVYEIHAGTQPASLIF